MDASNSPKVPVSRSEGSDEGINPGATIAAQVRGRKKQFWKRFLQQKLMLLNLAFLVLVAVCAIAPDAFAPFDPAAQSLRGRLEEPFSTTAKGHHWLGTDSLGRDVLSRVIHGARISMIVAVSSILVAGTIGIALGLISGYRGGLVDDIIGWFTNVQLSFPFILLAVAVVAVLGPGLRNVILVLGVTTWVIYGRVVRGEVLALRDCEYVEAARVAGASTFRVLIRHILPNIMTPLIIITTFQIAQIIIAEASLSFLGLGAGSSSYSWGTLMADGRKDLATSWWIATMPGIAIMLTVLAVNLLGDWLRDELDPRIVKE